jgi:colanic acid biosynthesis glycosyl transferase WcaI
MRILMLTQLFSPEPQLKGLGFAKALISRGHEVEVLTGFPNYPGGKLYPGYQQQPLLRERLDGVSIIRVPLYPSHDRSAVRRVATYGSFALTSSLLGPLAAHRADVMYVYHPPATVGVPALAIWAALGIPFVYDIQDLWPDTLEATGMVNSPAVLGAVRIACDQVHRAAARIVVLSEGFRERLIARGVPAEKIEVIPNWCEDEQSAEVADEGEREPRLDGRFNVVFAGTMGRAQALDAVLEAARRVGSRLPAVQFVFVGGGIEVPHLQREAERLKLTNTLFLPRRPVSQMRSLYRAADVLLVHLKRDPLFSITIPSKTQAYLAAGRPILIGVEGEAARMVEQAGAGRACRPEDPDDIAAGVEALFRLSAEERERMGARGRAYYLSRLSQEVGVARFEAVLEKAASCRPGRLDWALGGAQALARRLQTALSLSPGAVTSRADPGRSKEQ